MHTIRDISHHMHTIIAPTHLTHSRQHSHFVMGVTQFMNCVEMFLGPAMIAFFVHDETDKAQWVPVYAIMAALMIAAALVFLRFSDVTPPAYIADRTLADDQHADGKQSKGVENNTHGVDVDLERAAAAAGKKNGGLDGPADSDDDIPAELVIGVNAFCANDPMRVSLSSLRSSKSLTKH